MPRLFFPEGVGNIQRLQVRYASECKVPNEKRKNLWRVCEPLLRSKTKLPLPKQSVKFKCQIWYKIIDKIFKEVPRCV